MKIIIPYMQYQIDFAKDVWSSWVPATFDLDENGVLQSVEVEESDGSKRSISIASNASFRCIDPKDTDNRSNVYWIVIDASQNIYRANYNQVVKSPNKATPIGRRDKQKSVAFNSIVTIPKGFDEKAYNDMVAEANRCYKESQLTSDFLLSKDDLDTLVRAPDVVVTERLLDTTDFALARTRQFQKQCDEAYLGKVKEELSELLAINPDYKSRKIALKAYLATHFAMQDTSLAYLALPKHPVTILLSNIALRIGQAENKPAIAYLFPGVYTESLVDDMLDLDTIPIAEILSTHMLDSSQKYLLPVKLLLAETRPIEEGISLLKGPRGLKNPYYFEKDKAESAYISDKDLANLYQHSQLSQLLRDNYQRYLEAISGKTNLLGQLNTLIPILKSSDAHGGVGRQEDVAEGAYPAIMAFIAYYRQLNPMGLYISDTMPTLESLPEDSNIGYVLVNTGADSGLYCVSRYDNSIKKLCDNEQKQRYPINLLRVKSREDIDQLSTDRPTLIRVEDDLVGKYLFYGKTSDTEPAVWKLTEIEMESKVRFPDELGRMVTLSLGNVPEDVYAAIQDSHIEPGLMMTSFKDAFPKTTDACTLEQLNIINAHTGHLDLSEFKNVPDAVRKEINEIWEFIQNPAKNTSAVSDFETCVGSIRERLEEAVGANTTALEAIRWSEQATQSNYQESLKALQVSRDSLYANPKGASPIPPTPRMLKYLGIPLVINTPEDLEWLYTFSPESLEDFLFDEDNPSPRQYLQSECKDLGDIAIMLTNAPARSFAPLLKALELELTHDELAKLLGILPQDKTAALLFALADSLPNIINNISKVKEILQYLNDEQSIILLNAMKMHIVNFILSKDQLIELLKNSSEVQRDFLLYGMKEDIVTIIKDGYYLGSVLQYLNESQHEAFLDTIKEHISTIFKNGNDLQYVLKCFNASYPAWVQKTHDAIFDAIKDDLKKLIDDGDELSGVLQYLNRTQRTVAINIIKDDLARLIKDGNQLRLVLIYLYVADRDIVFDAIKDRFETLITDKEQLLYAIEYLNNEQSIVLLNAIKTKLANFFNDPAELKTVLKYLDNDKRTILLGFIKGVVSEQEVSGNIAEQRKLKVALRKSQEIEFPYLVTNNLQISYLALNLKNYLSDREREYPLSWKIASSLCVLVDLFSKDAKCGACAYLLDVIENKRHPYILLEQAKSLPDIEILKDEEYKHSYIWVNQRDLYFIDYKGAPHLVEIKDAQKLQDTMQEIFIEENEIRKSHDELENLIGQHVKMLPTTAQKHALNEGRLGKIIKDSGCMDNIFECFRPEENLTFKYPGM